MKKILSRFLVLTMIISLCVGFVQVSAAEFTVTLGAPATADVGTQFDLTYTASGMGADVASMWTIIISYDNTKVSPVRFTSGANNGKAMFTSTLYAASAISVTEPTASGNTSYVGVIVDGDELAATTLLGSIKFNATAAGNPAFAVVNAASNAADFSANEHTIVGSNPTMTITAAAATKYAVTVTGGTSPVTEAEKDEVVSITAGTAPVGQQFKNWTSPDAVVFADANAASTTFTMLESAVTVVANYEDIPASSNADLSALTVTGATLSPAFAVNNLEYTATVANSVEEVTINATKADTNATVEGDGLKALAVGPNAFNVDVTAEDTTTVKTYVVTITREAPAVVGAAVEIGDVSGYVGSNVVVPITITDMTALNNYDIGISYDSTKLQYISTAKGASLTESPSVYSATLGKVGLAGLTVEHGVAGLAGDVVVVNITFKVIGTVTGNDIVSSDIIVLSGRYNSTDVTGTNLVNGTVSYTNATDPFIAIADDAVEAFEAVADAATTISAIEAALISEELADAQDAVDAITLTESQAAKDALQDRIDAATLALNEKLAVLQAEEAATAAVVAYETAPITTLEEIDAAEDLALAAYALITPLEDDSLVEVDLLGRMADRDLEVATTKAALIKEAALEAINAGTATIADYQVIAPDAVEALLDNYKRGVIAGGSDLIEAEVLALVAEVNDPTAPVISNVTIVGQAVTGVELSVTYDYYDADFDLDAGQTIVWTGAGTPANELTYTIVAGDVGNAITVSVAGVSSSDTLPVILRGDVTKDGQIKSDDAFAIRDVFHDFGTYTAQQKEAANYDAIGIADGTDIIGVLIYAAQHSLDI